jgi:L-threonylcarbamoyladenylate synthase
MKTKILKSNQIDEAVSFLKKGELVALPTETVYGLAADATNEKAVSKIFSAKGRPSDHPLIVHLDSFDKVIDWVEEIPDSAQKLADYFWPGPLTMIFQKKKWVSDLVTGSLGTIALRVPKHPIALTVIKKLGSAVAAPSANAHKRISPTKPEHVLKTLSGKIAAIVDGGSCSIGVESTIIDMTSAVPVILRPGAITRLMIEPVLNINIQEPLEHQQKVPGNMTKHYQPEKPLFLISMEEINRRLLQEKNVAIMHHSDIIKTKNATYYKMPKNKAEYARSLYEMLHSIDSTQVDKIFVEKPPSHSKWFDISDRLYRASSK